MQTKIRSDDEMALWCFPGLWHQSSLMFTKFCLVNLERTNNKICKLNNPKCFFQCSNVSGDVNVTAVLQAPLKGQ